MSQDCTFIIFGATGNLSQLKLMPALYHLDQAGKLSDGFKIIACGRRDLSTASFLEKTRGWVAEKAHETLTSRCWKNSVIVFSISGVTWMIARCMHAWRH